MQAAEPLSIDNGMMAVMRQSLDASCILSRVFRIDINCPIEMIFLSINQPRILARSRVHTLSSDCSDGEWFLKA